MFTNLPSARKTLLEEYANKLNNFLGVFFCMYKKNQRYDYPQTLVGPQTIHHTFVLGGDKVGVMTIIFKQQSLPTERDSARSRVFFPMYFKAEAVRKKSRQLQVLLGKNHLLFVVEMIYHTSTFSSVVISCYVYNSQAEPMSTARRPSKSTIDRTERCHDQMLHTFEASSGQTAEVTPWPIQLRRRLPFNN